MSYYPQSKNPKMAYHRGYRSWYDMQFMPPALHEIGSMWIPKHNHVDVYNSSGCDIAKAGWRKWNSAGHWDMHADSATAVYPDWYKRRQEYIRDADQTWMNWQYDRWYKPTLFQTFGVRSPDKKPVNTGLTATHPKPERSMGDIPPTRYALYHPHNYEQPSRAAILPPVHDPKHQ